MKKIRVRFAPSPTGYLHVGGLRTALYNYLFAKKNSGDFILRIEDTDRSRFVPGAIENLIEVLNWAGLEFDEGPHKNGKFGPYIQSERLQIYNTYVMELLEKGFAYRCFCSPERLDKMRKEQLEKGGDIKYDRFCLSLGKEDIFEKLKNNTPHTIRLKIPVSPKTVINDLIRGEVEFSNSLIDDQVLLKSDGFPTYHLANVIDDHLMEISHVIRGEEWLSSTPKHIILYNYFNWEVPSFAHLPLLLNPDRSKLSKRQGDVAVEDYRAKGYSKEALLNFIALLGWNPGDDQEFFNLKELIEKFSLEKVSKSGAIFNLEKLNWLNAEHLRKKNDSELVDLLKFEISNSKYSTNTYSDDYLREIVTVMKERVSFMKEIITDGFYFFEDPETYDEEIVKKRWKNDIPELLKKLAASFGKLENPQKEDYEKILRSIAEELNTGAGKIIHAVRLAVSGVGAGPGVFDLLHILGKEKSINRIYKAIENIKV